MAILQVQHLEKHFGKTQVLKDISFELEKGRALAIIGSSGSGKTTLDRVFFLETPTHGKILVEGQTLFDAEAPATQKESKVRKKRLHFGMVFQSFNLFPQYTVLKNVTLAKELLAKERPDYKANKKQILEEIRAGGAAACCRRWGWRTARATTRTSSPGGQQQRVAIARALALSPDILCFDEPTSALDPELTGEVLKVIRSLAEQNTTMIIVTHEMAFARDVADQAIFMDKGVIVERGSARQVIDSPREERTRQFLSRYSKS